MRLEHFVYGSFEGLGRRLVTSANIDQILSTRSLNHLKDLNGSDMIQTWLPEGYVAITFLHTKLDEYERETIWNHTILVPVNSYFRLHQDRDKQLFKEHYIDDMLIQPKTLAPLKVKVP